MFVTAFGREKIVAQKIKKQFFQDKFYSLKAHAHYFTVFIYLATWRAAKLGIFTHMFTNLPQCSQSMNSLIYIYSIQIPSYLLWVLDRSHGHTFSCYCCPKKVSVLPTVWPLGQIRYNALHWVSEAVPKVWCGAAN